MKTNLFLRRVLWLMIPLLTMFTTNVWGAENTITLTYNSFGLTTTYAKKTATVSSIGFTVDQGYKGNGNVIQMNSSKGSGILYNTTAIKGLKSIAVTVSSGSKKYTITTGTSEKPTANSQTGTTTKTFNAKSGDTYFQLKVSGASYFSKIVITYDDSQTYHEWDGSNQFTTSTGGSTLKAVPSLCEWAIEPFGWCSEENYASSAYPTDKIWFETYDWPAGKTDLYALYRVGSDPYYYSTKPTIYTITYNLTNVTKDDEQSYSCMSDMADEVGTSNFYGYFKPTTGYILDESCISVTMGGSPVSPSNYYWDYEYSYPGHDYTAEFYMENITGNVVVTVTGKSCTQLADATGLAVENPSSSDATKVKFTWTLGAGTSTNAAKQVFTLTKVGGASQSKDLTKTTTSGTVALSGLSDGTYNWSIQAIGDGVSYCDGNVVEGPSFTICTKDVSAVTPTVNATTSITKTGATANWTAVSDADHYTVKVYAGATATGSAVKTYTNVIGTSQAITGLTAGTQYCVTVQAHDACSHDSPIGTGGVFTTDAATLYTVTFHNAAGDAPGAVTQTTEGGTVNIPSAEACDGWTFVGWKIGGAQSSTTSDPTGSGYITSALWPKTDYVPADNIDVYAVFSKTEGGGGGEPTAYSVGNTGNFVLAAQVGDVWYALPTTPTVNSGKITGVNLTVSETAGGVKYVTSANASGKTWTIANAANGQSISDGTKSGDKPNYLYHANGGSSGTNLAYGTGTTYTWKITSDANGLIFAGQNGSTTNTRGMLFSSTSNNVFGGYALSNKNASGYQRVQILPIAGGGTTTWKSDVSCTCPNYSFHSKNSSSVWEDPICFAQVGSSTLYRTEEIALPIDGVSFKVGWHDADDAVNAKTSEKDWSYMVAGLTTTRPDGGYWTVGGHLTSGNTGGAKGYFYVYSDSNEDNKYVGFTPSGYVLRWGKGESWTSKAFTAASASIDETEWNTEAVTLSSSNASDHIYVGLKTESGYVWCNNSEEQRVIFLSPGVWNSDGCKFALWDKTHRAWRGFMQDSDGDGIYEGTVPSDCKEVTFARFDGTKKEPVWNQQYNKSADQTISSLADKNMFSVTGWGSTYCEGNWNTVYAKPGVFRINAGSNLKNWSCKFVPHYVLTYDKNDVGASGSMDPTTVASDALSKTVSVAACGFTAPTGYHFDHWDTASDGSGTDYNPNDTYNLTADATLYAIWAPNNHTLTWDFNGGSSSETEGIDYTAGGSVNYGTKIDYPSDASMSKAGYTFTGWSSSPATMPDDNLTITAQWSVQSYTITWNVNGSTYTTGDPSTSAESGTKWSALTLPTAPADNTLSDCDRTKFVGWSRSQLFGDGNDAPADLFKTTSDANADSHTITEATTFYAVFAKGNGDFSFGWESADDASIWTISGFCDKETYNAYKKTGSYAGSIQGTSGYIQLKDKISPTSISCQYTKATSNTNNTSKFIIQTSSNGSDWTDQATGKTMDKVTAGTFYELKWTGSLNDVYVRVCYTGSNAVRVLDDVVISGGSFTDYATQCCTLKPVTNLAVSSKTANSVTLTWTAPSPTTGIDHLELRNASTDAKIGNNIAVGTTTTTVDGLNECTTYSYKIVSVGAVCETPSNIVEATPFGGSNTVTFNYNGGTGTPASFTTSCGNLSTTLPTPDARDGYTFLGWWTAADGGSKVGDAGDNYDVATTTTIHAHWVQNFTVTYELGGGTASPACAGGTYYVGEAVDVCTSTPTRVSSSFLGWLVYKTGDKNTTVTVTAGQFTMPAYNVTIEAQWETVYYHIYYKEEDGTAIATDDVLQTAETTLRDQTPCVGYTFFGWSTSKITSETTTKPSIIGKGGASYTPDADITVYPVYARSEGATTVKDTLTSTCIGSGTGYRSFTNFQHHSDAKYSGWATVGNSSIQMSEASGIVTTTSGGKLKHVTIKYHYKTGVDRSVDLYGQNSNYSNVTEAMSTPTGTKIGTAKKTELVNYEQTFELPSSGNDFDTEYEDFAIKCTYGAAFIEKLIVTWGTGTYYYATHCETKENVTVTYNGNGGTTTCGDGEHKVTWAYKNGGADAPELENPQTICSAATRDGGYILRDWTTGADGTGTHYTPGASITSLANDITLYAQWDRVYTVTFNDQGAITSRTQASGGASVAVPSATSPCIKDGVTWTFAGWGTVSPLSQSLAGHIIIPSGTNTYTPTEDVTLYAVYRKELGTSDAFAIGTSGAYKISAKYSSGTKTCYATTKGSGLYNCSVNAGDASTFYLNYVKSGTYAGKYTLQNSAGEYIGWSSSTTLSFSEETPAYYTVTQSGDGWLLRMDGVTGSARYFTHETSTYAYNFKAYTEANPVYFTPAAAAYYYTTMSCDDDFSITFHANGGTITWNMPLHGEGTYQHLADGTEIDVFPTASFDGWTFLGWRTADYDESTTAPEPSTIYGGSDGESGYHFTIHSNTDMYPIFTRFEDNEPFDQINGGDYYIYFLDENQIDEYGAYKRVYAASYSDNKRYNSTAVCDKATTFTFTKLDNGNWTIYDKTTNKYLYGVANDALKQQASATGAEWTLTLNGNQFDAFHVGTTYGQITASGNGTSATFMNYSRDNLKSNPGLYHRVYLGSCTNRTFTTNPSTTPNIEIHGQVKVTSTANKSIKAASVLTVSASNIATANLTVTSDNIAFKLSLTSNGTYTASVKIPVVSNKVGVTPIYVEYTPTEITNGIEEATITVSDDDVTPTEVSTESGDVQGRHVPANFVIAAKWGDKWYALPANCTESTSSTTGVLIEVDNALDPTRATAAPSYTKWGLQTVRPSRKAEYGTRLVFTEQLTTATADDQKTLYNGSTTSIQANAMYKNYMDVAAEKYEWIPTTTDLKDYVLTSATTLTGDANPRTVSLSNKGVFGTLLNNKAYDGKVRLLPATFVEPAEIQVVEWKASSVVVMYTGSGTKAITQLGDDAPSSAQSLSSAKVDHGVFELTTGTLTSAKNEPLNITIQNGSDAIVGRKSLVVPAIVSGSQNAPLGLETDETKLTDVVILDGATLSAVATKYTFKNITVYPGGKLVIGSGKQMGMNSLTLRGGSAWGAATYEHKYPQFVVNNATEGAYSNTSAVINYDYVTTKDQYYSFVLPYASNTKNIKYPLDIYGSAVSASNTGSFEFQYYDGAARAAGGTGWKVLEEDPSTGADLVVGKGYTFLGMPKKIYAYDGTDDSHANVRQRYGIHRIPMSVAAATVQAGETNSAPGKATPISVTLASKNNNSGWALVGNPYLSNVSGLSNQDIQVGKLVHTDTNPWDGKWQWDNPTTGVRYIVTTDDGQNFESQQASTATLKAFKNFFVQIKNGGATSLVIPANLRTDKDLAPARYMADVEQDIQLAVDLVSETRSDKVDLLINDIYTAEFDQDGDFTKMMNTTNFNLYGVYPGDNLSFIAVDKTTAAGSIAIGYQVPAAGEYTLQLSERPYVMSDYVETLLVTDHEVSPEVTTDLLENPYSFTVTKAETNDARFTVSIKLKENQDTPTDIDIINGGGDLGGEKPIKFIYHDKMYILRNGVLYDATGKKVREINK